MMGYWNDKNSTDKVLINRDNKVWYRTGDAGFVKNGFLYYNGRISENYKLSNGKFVNIEMVETNVKKYISGNLVVFGENENYNSLITEKEISEADILNINNSMDHYLKIKNVYTITPEEMSNFLTPKMSIKKKQLVEFIKQNKIK